jgi:hypothetical protein
VMSRGDRREAIFHGDADRQQLLRTLGQACLKTEWQVRLEMGSASYVSNLSWAVSIVSSDPCDLRSPSDY